VHALPGRYGHVVVSDGKRASQLRRLDFARDVLLNVLANLIAAAIVYLLAAVAGLLPVSSLAVLIATMLVGIGVAGASVLIEDRKGQRWARRFFLGTSMVVWGGFGLWLLLTDVSVTSFVVIIGILLLASATAFGAAWWIERVEKMRSAEAATSSEQQRLAVRRPRAYDLHRRGRGAR